MSSELDSTQGGGVATRPRFSSTTHPQEGSRLMQLPQEIRDYIYDHLFCSIRLMSGERAFGRIDRRRIVSASRGNALNVLRTCQRTWREIGNRWLGLVLFNFESPRAMLNKLALIPIHLRSQVRHVRVSGDPLMISFDDDDCYYRTAQVLKLLPGLQLDRLTVLANRGPEVSYDTLNSLIRHSNGWKELYYISHNSAFLGYKTRYASLSDQMQDRYLRRPQPSDWQRVMAQRDGNSSNHAVTIYRSKAKSPRCAVVLHPETRTIFRQEGVKSSQSYGRSEDPALMSLEERDKEILVVVKRGAGKSHAEPERSPYLPIGDIRKDCGSREWKQIKTEQDESDEEDAFGIVDTKTVLDSYTHVDEYDWPPLHFLNE